MNGAFATETEGHPVPRGPKAPGYRGLVIGAAVATYLLIVLGAVVRVTGSGLGCPDWPRCHGGLLPPLEFAAIVEYSHRLVAALDSLLIIAVVAATWLTQRHHRGLLVAATVIPLLLVAQIALGAVTVWLELPPAVVAVHLLTAMAILGLLVTMAVAATPGLRPAEGPSAVGRPSPAGLRRLALGTCAAAFALATLGALVRAAGATWACSGFPDCNGQLLPFGTNPLIDLHLVHRLGAYAFLALLGVTVWRAWKAFPGVPLIRQIATATAVAGALQFLIGAGAVASGVPTALRGLHVAGAAAVWAGTVALAVATTVYLQQRGPAASPAQGQDRAGGRTSSGGWLRRRAGAYLNLTKPGIIVLLLVTTATSMMVAARGFPPLPLLVFTLIGGALSAGAANAFNCYLDRDIDQLMSRTAHRPLVAGTIRPGEALAFGLVLAGLSVIILGVFVNGLAATLSLCGLLYYVFVYTCWLKRSTPSNIVIGGAAGAVPPLVGWAAVTGEVSLLAVYLFAIIFFWTPPHFWALALLIWREYERAGVPMLPIVRGEQETRYQILVYSVLLVVLSLAVVVLREVGIFYVLAAAALGGLFVYHALRLWRVATQRAARGLFRYSILYLGLLFLALVLDQWQVMP